MGLVATLDAPISFSLYSIGSPKAKVQLEDGSKFMVLLDTSVKMNVITRVLMEEANLDKKKKRKLELVSYTGLNWSFLWFL